MQGRLGVSLAAISGSARGRSVLIDVAGIHCSADRAGVSKNLGQSCVEHVCVGDAPAARSGELDTHVANARAGAITFMDRVF